MQTETCSTVLYGNLKCCVGQCISFVSNKKKQNRMYQNIIVTDTVCQIMLLVCLQLEISTT